MIYAIFFCSVFSAHPEASNCTQESPVIYRNVEDCKKTVDRMRADAGSKLGDSVLNGTPVHYDFYCMGKPTWTVVQ